jgi:heme/copper-type cytochrome/quinol oxidase subunit 1
MSENTQPRGITRFLPMASVAAVLIGIVCLIVGFWPQSASFGWSAYAPLANAIYLQDGARVFTRTAQVGVGVLVMGLIGLAFWGGLLVGRGSTPNPDRPDEAH